MLQRQHLGRRGLVILLTGVALAVTILGTGAPADAQSGRGRSREKQMKEVSRDLQAARNLAQRATERLSGADGSQDLGGVPQMLDSSYRYLQGAIIKLGLVARAQEFKDPMLNHAMTRLNEHGKKPTNRASSSVQSYLRNPAGSPRAIQYALQQIAEAMQTADAMLQVLF